MTDAPREIQCQVEKVERKEPPEPTGFALLTWRIGAESWNLVAGLWHTEEAARREANERVRKGQSIYVVKILPPSDALLSPAPPAPDTAAVPVEAIERMMEGITYRTDRDAVRSWLSLLDQPKARGKGSLEPDDAPDDHAPRGTKDGAGPKVYVAEPSPTPAEFRDHLESLASAPAVNRNADERGGAEAGHDLEERAWVRVDRNGWALRSDGEFYIRASTMRELLDLEAVEKRGDLLIDPEPHTPNRYFWNSPHCMAIWVTGFPKREPPLDWSKP